MTKRKNATSPASTRNSRAPHPLGSPRASTRTRSKPPAKARSASFTLAAECMVSNAGTLKAGLAALLDEPLAVTLDITALQRIDTAGLQVITAFVRERAVNGRPVEWQGTAPAFSTAAQLLGLTSLLKLPA